MKTYVLPALAIFSALLSCKSSDSSETEKWLTAGVWYEEEDWLDEDQDGVLTLIAYDNDCNKDDEYRFEAGGTFKYDGGVNHCEPAFPIAFSGTWEFREGETKIHIDVFGDPLDFEILEITETRLVLSLLFPDDPDVKLPYEKIVLRR